jgi:hypothetical protein
MGVYRAVGSGPKTRDGCSVDLYLKFPYSGEVEILEPLAPAGSDRLLADAGFAPATWINRRWAATSPIGGYA